MQRGDLVKMKYDMYWKLKSSHYGTRASWTNDIGVVKSVHGKGIKVYMPNGETKIGLVDHWELVK
tara:strand:- start:4715 stop:4909 length:195 start_codon:yes stop_codon:yes gene_type:complete